MPLNAISPTYLHFLQNISLVTIASFFAPLCTIIALCSHVIAPFTSAAKTIQHKRQWRASSSSLFRPHVILVTGVGMSKGLSIARAFYREGHIVIGADFEPYGVPVCGRFSTTLKRFYRLSKPDQTPEGSTAYITGLLSIIKSEKVELWVSCSGVASAIEDAQAAEAVEKASTCKAIQFGADLTGILHEKHSFIQKAQEYGLNVPETHYITSVDEAMTRLYSRGKQTEERLFIMKSVGLDDTIRADMTMLPRKSTEDTKDYLTLLKPSMSRPFVLQQFIDGPEYCTHSIVVRGTVAAFASCPSAELLMQYKALPPKSDLSIAMQEYTEQYAQRMGHASGHFSIDFMLDESSSETQLSKRLYPIECNPRAHTAVVLFENESEEMVNAYLGVLEGDKSGRAEHRAVVTPSLRKGYYWIGHELVAQGLVPLLSLVTVRASLPNLMGKWEALLNHIVYSKDGTYEIWDPWPFWWLYCVYWPGMFGVALITRSWWSRCNVSTTKMFRC